MPSTIDGFISTRGGESPMWSANFYLINPNGVVFGPNAFVDVGGAFHASTADYIRLADETIFSAAPAMGEVLTSAPPQAFGFLSSNPASIILDGSVLFVDPPADADTPGQTLSLVGGDVQLLGGAVLFAPGGLARIISVGSPGVVDLSSQDLGLGSFSRLGQVTISEFGGITAGGADFGVPGGTVMIRSGQLVLDTGAILLSDTADFPAAVLGIDIDARESVTIRDGAAVQTFSAGPADASGISITAGSLTVGDGGLIESFAFSDGKSGAVDISVGSAQILNGGAIRTTSGASNASDIGIVATGTLLIAGMGSEIATGAGGSSTDQTLQAGNISVAASNVLLQDGARIRSGGASEQPGENLSVTASDTLSISGLAGISSQAFSQSAGTVQISASRLTMDAGFISTSTLGTGNAGQIVVNANTVNLTNGAQIASSSQISSIGDGGGIAVNSPGSVTITGIGADGGLGEITFTKSARSGLFVSTEGPGSAGTIVADVGSLAVTGGAIVDSSTTGEGAGGSITLNAATQVSIADGGSVRADSLGTGATGNVTITAGDRIVMSDGSISTRAVSSDGGNIVLNAPNLIKLDDSQITTSVESGSGAGGNIFIDPQFMILNGSTITANAFGGPGGNITIVADNFLPSPDSVIEASSALSTPGTVQIESPENNVAGSIAQLPQTFADASRLLREACSARRAGTPSSFMVAGRGGVPADPDGYLPSFATKPGPIAGADSPTRPGLALAMANYRDCER
jgi:large exoprotein involved in heme utilization and adhesion